MIIQTLVDYYEQLLETGVEIPRYGYCLKAVKYILDINEQGELLDVVLNVENINNGKKEIERPIEFVVPDGGVRSSGVKAFFLCDKADYILGFKEKNFLASKELHEQILKNVDNKYSKAVLNFFDKWDFQNVHSNESIQAKSLDKQFETTSFVFRLTTDLKFIHEDKEIQEAWEDYLRGQSTDSELCLITGKVLPIARSEKGEISHGKIKGIQGGQAAGVCLVSYNADSFHSYVDSPISEQAAFSYVTALNYLLSSSLNRARIGDTTVIFFSEDHSATSDNLMAFPIGAYGDESEDLKGVFEKVIQGLPVEELTVKNLANNFYVIGLAPNNARVSVRFFMKNTLGNFLENIKDHVDRNRIVGSPNKEFYLPPWRLSKIALSEEAKEKNDELITSLLKSILTNSNYPTSFISKILVRLRADIHSSKEETAKHAIDYKRVGMIKAFLLKQSKYLKEDITVSLNKEFKEPAYLLGRLLATYEKVQEDAHSNETIKKNYFASASVTPASIFPIVIKSGELYLQKLEGGQKVVKEKLIGEIMSLLPAKPLPKTLDFEEQNLFVLGYYHQRQDFFIPKSNKEQ